MLEDITTKNSSHDEPTYANDYQQEVCSNHLSNDELEALAELECEYEQKRAEEQRIIKEELDRLYKEELRQKFEHRLLTAFDEIPPIQPVVTRYKSLICSEGNISAVVGEAKSKKTFLCTAIVSSLIDINRKQLFGIQRNRCQVLWIDTEQSREHIQHLLYRINLLSGMPFNAPSPFVHMLSVREEAPAARMNIMRYAIEYYQPKLVVVDGVSDLMNNTNDLQDSEALVASLLTLSSEYKCHIMSVLHTNPNSDKARGHLGSTLMRKAETVMYVHKVGGVSFVEPQYCRNEEFDRFAFRIKNAEDIEFVSFMDDKCIGLGLPVECDMAEFEDTKKEDDCVRILRENFGGSAERRLLCKKLEEVLGVTPSYSRTKVCRALERGLLIERDKSVTIADLCA